MNFIRRQQLPRCPQRGVCPVRGALTQPADGGWAAPRLDLQDTESWPWSCDGLQGVLGLGGTGVSGWAQASPSLLQRGRVSPLLTVSSGAVQCWGSGRFTRVSALGWCSRAPRGTGGVRAWEAGARGLRPVSAADLLCGLGPACLPLWAPSSPSIRGAGSTSVVVRPPPGSPPFWVGTWGSGRSSTPRPSSSPTGRLCVHPSIHSSVRPLCLSPWTLTKPSLCVRPHPSVGAPPCQRSPVRVGIRPGGAVCSLLGGYQGRGSGGATWPLGSLGCLPGGSDI